MPSDDEKEKNKIKEETLAMFNLKKLNNEIESRQKGFQKILSNLKCGITRPSLVKLIGKPDPGGAFIYGLGHLVWGQYHVQFIDDRVISYTDQLGLGLS